MKGLKDGEQRSVDSRLVALVAADNRPVALPYTETCREGIYAREQGEQEGGDEEAVICGDQMCGCGRRHLTE